jgi:uncharacterized UBP type Zn finger protein
MLKNTFGEEYFEGDNRYFCQMCDALVEKAVKHVQLQQVPPFLILTLNRFYFDRATLTRRKLLTPVRVSTTIDIKEFMAKREGGNDEEMSEEEEKEEKDDYSYDLQSVIIHAVSK